MKWNKGDEVVTVQPSFTNGQPPIVESHTISRVARKYFYIQIHHCEIAFDMETGEENRRGDFQSYLWQAYTPDESKVIFRREAALKRLHAHGIYFNGGDRHAEQFSVELLEKLCDVLDKAVVSVD